MVKPICVTHLVEMQCTHTGATVHYPMAQYIYRGDMWKCPTAGCLNAVFLRAPLPSVEGFHDNYYRAREEATVSMWNL